MEEQSRPSDPSLFGLTIDLNSKAHLLETASWTKFLAIAGFIFIGVMICWGILMPEVIENNLSRTNQEFQSTFPKSSYRIVMIVYVTIFGFIYFLPCLFTLRFSNQMKKALNSNNQGVLILAFKNLKITARYIGVLTIIFLSLFVIMAVVMLIVMPDLPAAKQ